MKDYDELLIALRRITRAIDLYSKRLQKETNLTISQLLVMEAIVKIDKPTPSAIAKSILLSQATVTNLIDRLEKNGLVQRKRLGTDKRTINVVLTELGEEKYKEAPELLQSGFLRKYRKLDAWEQHMLVSAVGRVASMMDAEDIDASPILTLGEIGVSDQGT
ncbi:MAG: MarR family transcriptional regulator [Gammaproteobacteria bacterium]|jgi:DNA-binding MarR family transcriptional regulator|nr:MarR family transcriptional regulator [Gammaproteobacteria bacterium]